MTILEAIRDPALFGPFFRNHESWQAWEALLSALFGLKLTKEQVCHLPAAYGAQGAA